MSEVDGSVDNTAIAFKFAEYFSNCYVCNNPERAAEIEHNYTSMRATYTVKRKSFETPKVRRTQLHPFLVFRNSFPIEFRNSISEFRNSIIKSFESPKMDAAESSSLLVFRNSFAIEFRNTSFGKNHCFCLLLLTLAFG